MLLKEIGTIFSKVLQCPFCFYVSIFAVFMYIILLCILFYYIICFCYYIVFVAHKLKGINLNVMLM